MSHGDSMGYRNKFGLRELGEDFFINLEQKSDLNSQVLFLKTFL